MVNLMPHPGETRANATSHRLHPVASMLVKPGSVPLSLNEPHISFEEQQ